MLCSSAPARPVAQRTVRQSSSPTPLPHVHSTPPACHYRIPHHFTPIPDPKPTRNPINAHPNLVPSPSPNPPPNPQLLWNRLEDVGPAAAPRLALLLPTLGCMRPDGAPGSRSPDARAQALADLCLAGMNTADYGIEQLSDAIMGLTLLGVVLSSAWMERFLEVGVHAPGVHGARGTVCGGDLW